MKTLLSKTVSIAAGVVAVVAALALLGLGLWVVLFLAMFGLVAFGVAILAAPFLKQGPGAQDNEEQGNDMREATTAQFTA